MDTSMLPGYIVFGILALMAVATAVAMLLSRQPVFAVLFLVLNFMTIAVLYLVLGAPFIALAQVTVYAGSIMILFLFVVMMLGSEEFSFFEPLKGQPWLVGSLVFLFLLLIGVFLFTQLGGQPGIPAPESGFGSPQPIGGLLMEKYVLPILIIGVIILIATIGAVVLTRRDNRQQSITDNASVDNKKPEGN